MHKRERVGEKPPLNVLQNSGDSNFSHHEDSDNELENGNRETMRRDAERQAAQQLERAKVCKLNLTWGHPRYFIYARGRGLSQGTHG